VGGVKRFADYGAHVAADGVRVELVLQARAEGTQRARRVVSAAVEPPVDRGPDPCPRRAEQNGDCEGGDRHREARLACERLRKLAQDENAGQVHQLPQKLTDTFRRLRKAAKIPTGSLHILRHTAVTLALSATPPVPLHVVAARIGDDPTTVLGTYSHLLATSDEVAADVIAGALVAVA